MKTSPNLLIGCFAVIVLCGAAIFASPYTVEHIRGKALEFYFDSPSQWTPISAFPDTSMFTMITTYGRTIKSYPIARGNNASYMYYNWYIAMDSNAYWNYTSFTYDNNFRTRFKTLFGQNPVKSQFLTLSNDTNTGEPSIFRFYDAAGIQAAFDKLYLKPTDNFRGILLGKFYNVAMREYLRRTADVMVKVLSNKQQFETYAHEYLAKAKTDQKFEGQVFAATATERLLKDFTVKSDFFTEENPSRIVGIMLRRQCDGTLPVLRAAFLRILKDYDPGYAAMVQGKL